MIGRVVAVELKSGTPDAMWDRLLYGIHGVERYLKTR